MRLKEKSMNDRDQSSNPISSTGISRRRFAQGLAAAPLALGAAARGVNQARAQDNVKLVVLTHWGTQQQKEPLDAILAEYTQANPNVEIEHQSVEFAELLNRITTGQVGGDAPDIYHFYNLWLPDFVGSELLSTPPEDVAAEIAASYGEGTVGGASFNGQAWGYPTEVNDYQLIYNKTMFEEAGIAAPPATFAELREHAKALTKGSGDNLTQAGILFLHAWDSGVVHPWTSLLWSNGGQYVAEDYSEVLFNQQPGMDTLQLQADIISDGSALLGTEADADFESGRAAMTIRANWWGATLRASDLGMENIGVGPIPHGEGGTSTALQYEWLWGVSNTSQNAEASWAFLKWLNGPRGGAAEASSPIGDFLTSALNAIPGRTSDQEAHADVLGDPFVKPFVDAFATSRSEPIIPGAQEIKTALQTQIESVYFGQSEPADALTEAADEANRILQEKMGS
jgi:multiple sugar transport system substrate-binding protein